MRSFIPSIALATANPIPDIVCPSVGLSNASLSITVTYSSNSMALLNACLDNFISLKITGFPAINGCALSSDSKGDDIDISRVLNSVFLDLSSIILISNRSLAFLVISVIILLASPLLMIGNLPTIAATFLEQFGSTANCIELTKVFAYISHSALVAQLLYSIVVRLILE